MFANPTRHYLIQHSEISNSTPPGRQRKLAAAILRNVILDFLLAIGLFYLLAKPNVLDKGRIYDYPASHNRNEYTALRQI